MIRLYQNGGPKDGANREEKREYVWQQKGKRVSREEGGNAASIDVTHLA